MPTRTGTAHVVTTTRKRKNQTCRNEALAKLRVHKCEDLLAATESSLDKIKARVAAGKLGGQDTASSASWSNRT